MFLLMMDLKTLAPYGGYLFNCIDQLNKTTDQKAGIAESNF